MKNRAREAWEPLETAVLKLKRDDCALHFDDGSEDKQKEAVSIKITGL